MLALRTLARSSVPITRRAPVLANNFTRTMASSSAPLQEWLVIIPDHKGALDKRVAARPKHLEGLKSDRDDMWLWGGTFHPSCKLLYISNLAFVMPCKHVLTYSTGAMLEEPIKEGDSGPPKMKGSAMLIGAKTKEEVIERVKKDVYVNEGVWDVDSIQIIPFRSAIRKAL
jgi:uncharacterized protein YciI